MHVLTIYAYDIAEERKLALGALAGEARLAEVFSN